LKCATNESSVSRGKWILKGLYKVPRPLLIALFIDLTLYAPMELSRVIVQSGMYYYPAFTNMLWMEIAVIWVYYVMSIALVSTVLYYRRPIKDN
jgi:hypothetical protein